MDRNGTTLKDLFLDSLMPVIFAIETTNNSTDLESFYNHEDAVILDIDASHAGLSNYMDSDLPDFPKELEMLKILNRIKNPMMDNYDKIYPERNIPQEYDQENFQVMQIREVFFRPV